MGKLTIVNNLGKFRTSMVGNMDRALNRMAIDIEKLAKDKVPKVHGDLQRSGYHLRVGLLNYLIIFNKVYAAYQEWAGDGKGKVVKHYTKAGTGAHYLRDSARIIVAHGKDYLKSEAFRLNKKTL